MQVPPVSGQDWPAPAGRTVDTWLDHLRRVSYIRGHISVYAVGSVVLLAANLLFGSGNVWADTAIMAWSVLVVVHGIVAIIARLLQELLMDDEPEREARPVSEMRWSAPSTWAIQPRTRESRAATDAQAASAAPPAAPPPPDTPSTPANDGERVSWKAATDAAWLASRDDDGDTTSSGDDADEDKPTQDGDNDDKNDFTPLKMD